MNYFATYTIVYIRLAGDVEMMREVADKLYSYLPDTLLRKPVCSHLLCMPLIHHIAFLPFFLQQQLRLSPLPFSLKQAENDNAQNNLSFGR